MTTSSTDGVTGADVAAIRARADAATEGPWGIGKGGTTGCNWICGPGYLDVLEPGSVECGRYCQGGISRIELSDADAEFIAHARTDVPALLDALAEAERQRDEALTTIARVKALFRPEQLDPFDGTPLPDLIDRVQLFAALTGPRPPTATVPHETTQPGEQMPRRTLRWPDEWCPAHETVQPRVPGTTGPQNRSQGQGGAE